MISAFGLVDFEATSANNGYMKHHAGSNSANTLKITCNKAKASESASGSESENVIA